jgi:amidohydrolase
MNDSLREEIASLAPELAVTRHHLHQNPELSEDETETSEFVTARLRALGLEPRTGIGGHGVVVEIDGGRPGRRLAIRADMDALPITEENDVPYRSRNTGVMHACGHDGHTTTLLGTAKILLERRNELAGSVRLIFQPAEETVGGARRMCKQGVMEGVDAIVALHGWPQIVLGKVGVRKGPMMASADTFDIVIHGRSGHAAYPHATIDPIVIGAEIVTALQTIASREIDPNDPVVVSITRFEAGTAYNVIPGTATLRGTYRTLASASRQSMPDRIRRIATGICNAHGATCDLHFREGTPPVVNDSDVIDLIERIATESLGAENVVQVPHSSMGAEDFAEYLSHAPGAMFRLGLGPSSPIHTPTFNFDDRALPIGVELFTRIALEYLRLPADNQKAN